MELLVALSLGSLIVGGTALILTQIFILVPRAEDSILAMRQVEFAGHWIDRDAVQAQTITPTPNAFNLSITPLVISYVKWDATRTTINYSVDSNRYLQRQVAVTDEKTGNLISSGQIQVAESIDSIIAQYNQPDPSITKKVLTVTIIAKVDRYTQTRVYKIAPRPF